MGKDLPTRTYHVHIVKYIDINVSRHDIYFSKKILGHVTMYSHCVGGVMKGVTSEKKTLKSFSFIGFKLVITFRNLFQTGTPVDLPQEYGYLEINQPALFFPTFLFMRFSQRHIFFIESCAWHRKPQNSKTNIQRGFAINVPLKNTYTKKG